MVALTFYPGKAFVFHSTNYAVTVFFFEPLKVVVPSFSCCFPAVSLCEMTSSECLLLL